MSDNSMFLDSHPDHSFYSVQKLLKHIFWSLEHTIIAIDMSRESEVGFAAELNIIKEIRILFNLVL